MDEASRPAPSWGEEWSIYQRLVGARIRSELQYRTSFAAFLTAQALITFLDCVAILAIFSAVPALGSWHRSQVVWVWRFRKMRRTRMPAFC